MRLNAQPENAFPSAEGSRGTNIGKDKTIDTTGSRLHLRRAAAFYLTESMKRRIIMNDQERKKVETMLEGNGGHIRGGAYYLGSGGRDKTLGFWKIRSGRTGFVYSYSLRARIRML